jgi:hypothetical protein
MSIYELCGAQGSPGSYNAGKIEPYVCRVPAHKTCIILGVSDSLLSKIRCSHEEAVGTDFWFSGWGSGLIF